MRGRATPWRNTRTRYGAISIALHWSVALAVLAMLGTAGWAWLAPSDGIAGQRLRTHGAIGMLAWALIAARIVWHFVERSPEGLADRPAMARLARVVHATMLVLIGAQLVTGPVDIWSGGWPVGVFDWVEISSPLGTAWKPWHDAIGGVHRFTGYTIALLVALHVAAALKHLLIDRDGTVQRMLGLPGADAMRAHSE